MLPHVAKKQERATGMRVMARISDHLEEIEEASFFVYSVFSSERTGCRHVLYFCLSVQGVKSL
jgi:hypothetical protein